MPQLVFAQSSTQFEDKHVIVAETNGILRIVETFLPLDKNFKEQAFGEYTAFMQVAKKAINQNQVASASINNKSYVCYTKGEFLSLLNSLGAQVLNPRLIKLVQNNNINFYPNLYNYQNAKAAVCSHSAYPAPVATIDPNNPIITIESPAN